MLAKNDLTLLRVFAEGNRKALEWSVGERTFQINGVRSLGLWERFFPPFPAHARCEPVSAEVILQALADATSPIKFWRHEEDYLGPFENAEAALEAAKAWVNTKG